LRSIWEFFNSLKLTVYLVLAITAVTMYGSIVIYIHPEIYGDMDQHLFLYWLSGMGVKTFSLSWWFFLLVGLVVVLGINTAVCTIERLPMLIKRYRNPLMNLRDIEMGGERGELVALSGGELSDILAKDRYSVFADGDALYAEKNRWVPFLPYVVHIGVLLFLVCHLISGLYGYRNSGLFIFEGETANSPAGGYQLRLDSVKVDYRPDGSMKGYGSELTAIKDGKTIKTATVTSNKPMFVEGSAVYQREFGETIKSIYLTATVKSTGFNGYVVIPKGANFVDIPGGRYRLGVEGFIGDAGVDPSGEPYPRSEDMSNPAILVGLYGPDGPKTRGWLFMKEPGLDSFRDDDVALKFSNIDVRAYSSFDVNRDPSAILALIASALVMFGSITTLYFRRERVWASMDKEGKRAQVVATDDEMYERLKG
jgi:cytochrome c biogenesis protein